MASSDGGWMCFILFCFFLWLNLSKEQIFIATYEWINGYVWVDRVWLEGNTMSLRQWVQMEYKETFFLRTQVRNTMPSSGSSH